VQLRPSRLKVHLATKIIYYLLIVANILMEILEITRLSLLHAGVGLLPFSFVALLFIGAIHLSAGLSSRLEPRLMVALNTFVWVGLMIMSIVRIVGLVYLENKGGIYERKGSKYPTSDQVIDVAVMAGVYLVLAVLEITMAAWQLRSVEKGIGLGRASAEEDRLSNGK
jgi:hypothetical protein